MMPTVLGLILFTFVIYLQKVIAIKIAKTISTFVKPKVQVSILSCRIKEKCQKKYQKCFWSHMKPILEFA